MRYLLFKMRRKQSEGKIMRKQPAAGEWTGFRICLSLCIYLLVFLLLTFLQSSLISNNYKFNEKEYSAGLLNVGFYNNKEGILWDDEISYFIIRDEDCAPCHMPYPLLWEDCTELQNILLDDQLDTYR